MAEACPGTSLSKLAWLVAWHIRDESYAKGETELGTVIIYWLIL